MEALTKSKVVIVLYDIPPAQIRGNTRAHFQTLNSLRRQRKEMAMWLAKDAMSESGINNFVQHNKLLIINRFLVTKLSQVC